MNKCELSNGFETFWNTYPRKVAKGAARRAYEKARKLADHDAIMAGLGRYIAYLERYPTESRFICHASTWLNQERWTDELEPPRADGLRPDQILFWQSFIKAGKTVPDAMKAILRENGLAI